MSGWADRAVSLVARTLPPTIRDRYREEWRADVAAAAEAGITPASVAVGAAVFSATLDRDAPAIAGIPTPAISRRHAHWAFTFTALVATVVVGRGPFGDLWLPLVVALLVVALVHLWAAARLSHGLARTSAALATTAFVILVAASTIPMVVSASVVGSRYLYPLAMLLLVASLSVGLYAWARRPWLSVLVAGAGVVVLALGMFLLFVPVALIAVLVVATGVIVAGARDRRHAPSSLRGARVAVIVASVVMATAVALSGLDLLVVAPQWMAGGYTLSEAYATLTDGVRAAAVGNIVIWIVAATVAVIGYLVVGLVALRHPRAGDRRVAILSAIGLIALVMLSAPIAGVALWDGLLHAADPLPGLNFGASPFRYVLQGVGSVALAVAVIGWIAPRPVAVERELATA
jgi:hypothetical protein